MDDTKLALALVTGAAEVAVAMREGALMPEQKTSTADLVTAADRAAEKHVHDVLRRERPDDGMTGEEGADWAGRNHRRWVADPIDGTYNYVSGLPAWCSAVALEEAGRLSVGAACIPSSGETWIAANGQVQLNGARVEPIADRALSECSVATYLDAESVRDSSTMGVLLTVVGAAATLRMSGSGTCDLADVAADRLGLWIQNDSDDWDWLPGRALVEGVGGRTAVVLHAGHRWHIAGSPRAVAKALQLIQESRG